MRAYGPTTGPFPNEATAPPQVPARHAVTQAKAPSIAVLPGRCPRAGSHLLSRLVIAALAHRSRSACGAASPSAARRAQRRAQRVLHAPAAPHAVRCALRRSQILQRLREWRSEPPWQLVAVSATLNSRSRSDVALFSRRPLTHIRVRPAGTQSHLGPVPLRPGPTWTQSDAATDTHRSTPPIQAFLHMRVRIRTDMIVDSRHCPRSRSQASLTGLRRTAERTQPKPEQTSKQTSARTSKLANKQAN